jgi:hypothetical protein
MEYLYFWRIADRSLSSTSSSSLSLFSLCRPRRPRRPFPEPQLPRAALPYATCLSCTAPAASGPLLAPSLPLHVASPPPEPPSTPPMLASSCFTHAVFLLALKLAQEFLSTSFTHSTAPHYLSFLPPLDYSRRSSAAALARHRQLPLPSSNLDPVL